MRTKLEKELAKATEEEIVQRERHLNAQKEKQLVDEILIDSKEVAFEDINIK